MPNTYHCLNARLAEECHPNAKSHAPGHSKSSAPGRELMHCVPYTCYLSIYCTVVYTPPQICDDPYGMVSTVLILFDIGYGYIMQPLIT